MKLRPNQSTPKRCAPVPLSENALIWYARHFPISRGKLRLVNTLWPRFTRGGSPKRTASLIYGEFVAPCDLREMLQRQLYFFGTYFLERHALECWSTLALRAGTVLDVRANAGIYSLAALAANPKAVVHAFEPTPEIADRLLVTAQMNHLKSLHVHKLAVLERDGDAALHRLRGDDDSNEGMNFVTPGSDPALLAVHATSLDTFCSSHGIASIDLVKLDIQGQEHSALAGATEMLNRGAISTIVMELNWTSSDSLNDPASCAIQMLEAHGFSFSHPSLPLVWRSGGLWLRSLHDVVAQRVVEGD